MKVIFELSKEYNLLPADEVIYSIKGEEENMIIGLSTAFFSFL